MKHIDKNITPEKELFLKAFAPSRNKQRWVMANLKPGNSVFLDCPSEQEEQYYKRLQEKHNLCYWAPGMNLTEEQICLWSSGVCLDFNLRK